MHSSREGKKEGKNSLDFADFAKYKKHQSISNHRRHRKCDDDALLHYSNSHSFYHFNRNRNEVKKNLQLLINFQFFSSCTTQKTQQFDETGRKMYDICSSHKLEYFFSLSFNMMTWFFIYNCKNKNSI